MALTKLRLIPPNLCGPNYCVNTIKCRKITEWKIIILDFWICPVKPVFLYSRECHQSFSNDRNKSLQQKHKSRCCVHSGHHLCVLLL